MGHLSLIGLPLEGEGSAAPGLNKASNIINSGRLNLICEYFTSHLSYYDKLTLGVGPDKCNTALNNLVVNDDFVPVTAVYSDTLAKRRVGRFNQ